MIKIKYKVEKGDIVIDIKGHAGYAEAGKDIVCSAVSAISQAAILGLISIAEEYKEFVEVEEIV